MQHQLVAHTHEPVFHVVAYGCDQLETVIKKLAGELCGDVALVTEQLAKQSVRHSGNRDTVVHVARCNLEGKHLPALIDHKAQLEAVEPAFGGFSPLGNTLEDVDLIRRRCNEAKEIAKNEQTN